MTDDFNPMKHHDDALELPSEEVMRREVETGVFSPESIEIARSIQAEAPGLDLFNIDDERYYMERTNSELRQMAIDEEDAGKRQKSFIEKETDGIMARVTTPNAGEAMKHFVKASQKAAEATKQFAEAVDKAGKQFAKTMKALKPKYVPEPHLTYRPFHTPEMVEFRKNLLLR